VPAPRATDAGLPSYPPEDESWKSWWTQPAAPPDLGATSEPDRPPPAAPIDPLVAPLDQLAQLDTAGGTGGGTGLARRTPQASLADQLRRPADGPGGATRAPAHPARDPLEARSALTRFQANQRAARAGEEER
jgi:hypothetical protein